MAQIRARIETIIAGYGAEPGYTRGRGGFIVKTALNFHKTKGVFLQFRGALAPANPLVPPLASYLMHKEPSISTYYNANLVVERSIHQKCSE